MSLICVPCLSSKFGGMIRSKGEDQPSSQITMNNSSQTPRAPSSEGTPQEEKQMPSLKSSSSPLPKKKRKKMSSFKGESVKNQRRAKGATLHPLHEHPLKEVMLKGLKWACDSCTPVPASGETQQYPSDDSSKRYRCVFKKRPECDFDLCEKCFNHGLGKGVISTSGK